MEQHHPHASILNGIARLSDPRHHEERHKLIINACCKPPVDQHSLQHLVNFLGEPSRDPPVTELTLTAVRLLDPSDGGVNVLRDFFSRSDTTLTKVNLDCCDFGSAEDASQLLGAFERNSTVKDLTIHYIEHLRGAALGACLSGLLLNMPQLEKLGCKDDYLDVEGVRAFQPGLRNNHALKELNLQACGIRDEGIRLIADALVGNSTLEIFHVSNNEISSRCLDDITRLLESTQLKSTSLGYNTGIFNDNNATQRFARILSRHEFLKKLTLSFCGIGDGAIRLLVDGLVGNTIMESLDISQNHITSVGLADITRLLESTRLKTINFWQNRGVFNDTDATQHFVATLVKNATIQELQMPWYEKESLSAANIVCARNQSLAHVDLLLAPPPPPPPSPQQQHERNTSTMLLKTWHKAITKFAMVPNNAGASAIFKLFTARPQLLEKRLKRPASSAGAVSQEQKRGRF